LKVNRKLLGLLQIILVLLIPFSIIEPVLAQSPSQKSEYNLDNEITELGLGNNKADFLNKLSIRGIDAAYDVFLNNIKPRSDLTADQKIIYLERLTILLSQLSLIPYEKDTLKVYFLIYLNEIENDLSDTVKSTAYVILAQLEFEDSPLDVTLDVNDRLIKPLMYLKKAIDTQPSNPAVLDFKKNFEDILITGMISAVDANTAMLLQKFKEKIGLHDIEGFWGYLWNFFWNFEHLTSAVLWGTEDWEYAFEDESYHVTKAINTLFYIKKLLNQGFSLSDIFIISDHEVMVSAPGVLLSNSALKQIFDDAFSGAIPFDEELRIPDKSGGSKTLREFTPDQIKDLLKSPGGGATPELFERFTIFLPDYNPVKRFHDFLDEYYIDELSGETLPFSEQITLYNKRVEKLYQLLNGFYEILQIRSVQHDLKIAINYGQWTDNRFYFLTGEGDYQFSSELDGTFFDSMLVFLNPFTWYLSTLKIAKLGKVGLYTSKFVGATRVGKALGITGVSRLGEYFGSNLFRASADFVARSTLGDVKNPLARLFIQFAGDSLVYYTAHTLDTVIDPTGKSVTKLTQVLLGAKPLISNDFNFIASKKFGEYLAKGSVDRLRNNLLAVNFKKPVAQQIPLTESQILSFGNEVATRIDGLGSMSNLVGATPEKTASNIMNEINLKQIAQNLGIADEIINPVIAQSNDLILDAFQNAAGEGVVMMQEAIKQFARDSGEISALTQSIMGSTSKFEEVTGTIRFPDARPPFHNLVSLINQGENFVAHGTNAKSFETIMQSGGVILSRDKLLEKGVSVTSGENLIKPGQIKGVSGFNLRSSINVIDKNHGALSYAKRASNLERNEIDISVSGIPDVAKLPEAQPAMGLSPKNINLRIGEVKNLLRKKKEFPLQKSLQKNLEKLLADLELLKAEFERLSQRTRDKFDRLSQIPVVVIGEPSEDLRVVMRGLLDEVQTSSINVRLVLTDRNYIPIINRILKNSGFEDVTVKSFQDFEAQTVSLTPSSKITFTEVAPIDTKWYIQQVNNEETIALNNFLLNDILDVNIKALESGSGISPLAVFGGFAFCGNELFEEASGEQCDPSDPNSQIPAGKVCINTCELLDSSEVITENLLAQLASSTNIDERVLIISQLELYLKDMPNVYNKIIEVFRNSDASIKEILVATQALIKNDKSELINEFESRYSELINYLKDKDIQAILENPSSYDSSAYRLSQLIKTYLLTKGRTLPTVRSSASQPINYQSNELNQGPKYDQPSDLDDDTESVDYFYRTGQDNEVEVNTINDGIFFGCTDLGNGVITFKEPYVSLYNDYENNDDNNLLNWNNRGYTKTISLGGYSGLIFDQCSAQGAQHPDDLSARYGLFYDYEIVNTFNFHNKANLQLCKIKANKKSTYCKTKDIIQSYNAETHSSMTINNNERMVISLNGLSNSLKQDICRRNNGHWSADNLCRDNIYNGVINIYSKQLTLDEIESIVRNRFPTMLGFERMRNLLGNLLGSGDLVCPFPQIPVAQQQCITLGSGDLAINVEKYLPQNLGMLSIDSVADEVYGVGVEVSPPQSNDQLLSSSVESDNFILGPFIVETEQFFKPKEPIQKTVGNEEGLFFSVSHNLEDYEIPNQNLLLDNNPTHFSAEHKNWAPYFYHLSNKASAYFDSLLDKSATPEGHPRSVMNSPVRDEITLVYSAIAIQHPSITLRDIYFDGFKDILITSLAVNKLPEDNLEKIRPIITESLLSSVNLYWSRFEPEEKIKIISSAISYNIDLSSLINQHSVDLINLFKEFDLGGFDKTIYFKAIRILTENPSLFYRSNTNLMLDLLRKLNDESSKNIFNNYNEQIAQIIEALLDSEYNPDLQIKFMELLGELKGSDTAFQILKKVILNTTQYTQPVRDKAMESLLNLEDPRTHDVINNQRNNQYSIQESQTNSPESTDICLMPIINIHAIVWLENKIIIPMNSLTESQNVKIILRLYDDNDRYIDRIEQDESITAQGKFVEIPAQIRGINTAELIVKNDQGIIGNRVSRVIAG